MRSGPNNGSGQIREQQLSQTQSGSSSLGGHNRGAAAEANAPELRVHQTPAQRAAQRWAAHVGELVASFPGCLPRGLGTRQANEGAVPCDWLCALSRPSYALL